MKLIALNVTQLSLRMAQFETGARFQFALEI